MYVEDILNSKEEPETVQTAAPAEETKPEETKPAEETKPEETKPDEQKPEETKPDEQKPEETKPEETKPDETRPDLSQISKEEKQAHAFRAQLAKQKSKYEQTIEEMKNTFQSQIDEIKKSVAKPAEPKKTRKDFSNDDEYIDYLTEQRVNSIMEVRDRQAAKEAADREADAKKEAEAQAIRQEAADRFNEACRVSFTDPNEYQEFAKRVDRAIKNDLASVLDEAPAVRDFIFQSADGPVLLDAMLKDRDTFVRVMSRKDNPMEATIECHDIARECRAARNRQQPAVQKPAESKPAMPNLGKPGGGGSTGSTSMFDSDQDLINYVRGNR